MSTLVEKFPNAINSRHLTRGLGLSLTGALLMGSLIDCDGEGPQFPTSLDGQGGDKSLESVVSQEIASLPRSLGDSALAGVVPPSSTQVAAPSFELAIG